MILNRLKPIAFFNLFGNNLARPKLRAQSSSFKLPIDGTVFIIQDHLLTWLIAQHFEAYQLVSLVKFPVNPEYLFQALGLL